MFKTLPCLANDDFWLVSADTKTCGSPLYLAPPTGKGASYGRVIVCLLAPKGQAKHRNILTSFQTKVKKKGQKN